MRANHTVEVRWVDAIGRSTEYFRQRLKRRQSIDSAEIDCRFDFGRQLSRTYAESSAYGRDGECGGTVPNEIGIGESLGQSEDSDEMKRVDNKRSAKRPLRHSVRTRQMFDIVQMLVHTSTI